MILRRRQGVALMLAALLLVTVTAGAQPAAAIEEGGSVGGTTGGDALTQVMQAVTQLAQQVSQIAQMVGTILTQGVGRFFGGLGGTLPGAWGISQLPTSAWLTQLAQWVTGILGQAQSAVWSEWGSEWGQAPDYSYSTTQIAAELGRIAAALPADIAQWVEALAARLVQAPAPVPGTPQASSTAAATINPVFAGREHAVQEAQVAATATQAAAQAAAEQAQQAAALATADATPQAMAQASQQTAQTTATAEVSAPSTRAAVEVMAAALTQQNAQAAAQQAALAARLDALVTQQAQIATQLSLVVAGLASASGLLSQQLTQQIEETAQGAAAMQDNMAGAGSALAGQLNFIGSGGDAAALDRFLTPTLSGP